ncbi:MULTISPECIES: CAP domain-containing protein [unclassified Clostridioides]|uniref:CAP domain-containing protein n=1 Tax=unclassified Clostridioides TaxID=2635829 RepID=UPI001D0CCC31|nr:sporulation protein [Clostridioides sp. ES-S-0049-03]MCC0675769.1 sporulation protein [Clostridioides sp. ES-W-0018-02]MCC0695532.1 sporulation protein [Clostridioides sp. ES-S-0048-02]MCC0707429.1 sporulation protein [Clostridioides sp. ES-S-0190-01]MCC0709422.1 sporulation protein [Clostridioides sp. ES-W-0017-02]MCC0761420.1 sporulation protein [Clostridioides sp. ES-S-0006-03]UDN59413.1 sporulation protein [Clostridioides sp. ES-S-0010-02]UDN61057.1 sporulation protein [Clostridioides
MRKNIPTKLKTILALGVLTLATASSAVTASASSLENNMNISNKNLVYTNAKFKFSAKPNCSVKPELKPDKDNSCKDKNHNDKNCNITNKPNGNNNSGSTNKPEDNNNSDSTKPEDNDNSGSTNKPEDSNKPEDNNNSDSNNKPEDNNNSESNKPEDNNNSDSNNKPEDNNNSESNKPEDNNNSGSTTGNFSAYQKEVVDLVNVERSKAGLNPLTLDADVSNVATKKSQDMIDNNYFAHNSPTYGSPFDMLKKFGISYKTAGENIAMGQKTPKEVVNAWMNSEGHRKNILNPNYSKIGVGVAQKSGGSIYWTQIFVG